MVLDAVTVASAPTAVALFISIFSEVVANAPNNVFLSPKVFLPDSLPRDELLIPTKPCDEP